MGEQFHKFCFCPKVLKHVTALFEKSGENNFLFQPDQQ